MLSEVCTRFGGMVHGCGEPGAEALGVGLILHGYSGQPVVNFQLLPEFGRTNRLWGKREVFPFTRECHRTRRAHLFQGGLPSF